MPLGVAQVLPASLVMTAEAPSWAMANQVLLVVAASPVSMKNGNQEMPPAGQPAPDATCHVAPPSVDSSTWSCSCRPLMRWVASLGSTTMEYRLPASGSSGIAPVKVKVRPPSVDLNTCCAPFTLAIHNVAGVVPATAST